MPAAGRVRRGGRLISPQDALAFQIASRPRAGPGLTVPWQRGDADIPGAAGPFYAPGPPMTALVSARVTARNSLGQSTAASGAMAVRRLPDVTFTQKTGVHMLNASLNFVGQGLTFQADGPGMSIDPATGQVTISSDVLLSGIEVTVTDGNSGGSPVSRFRVTVATQEDAVVKPAPLMAPTLSGTGMIGASVAVDPGQWSGQPEPTLALQWRAGEVAIPGATAADFVPTPAEDGADLDCLVTATNDGGSEALAAGPLRVTQAPPVALGAIADLVLTQGDAPGRVEAAGHFSGAGLSFSVEGAVAEVDASGVISVPTGGLLAEEVVVTASNSGGSAEIRFHVTVAKQKDPVVQPPVALDAIADLVLTQGGAPGRVEAAGHFSGTGLSFSVDGAGAEVDASGVIVLPTGALLAEEPVRVTASNAGGAATALFRMSVIPAKIDPALIQIDEITSTSDPDSGNNGGRRRLILGDIVIPAGYELRWTSPDVDGGIPPGTIVTPNATSVRNNSLAVGVTNYNVLYWYRISDGVVFNALTPGQTTANGKAVTATALDATAGQVALTMAGLSTGSVTTTWSSIGSTAIAEATDATQATFTNKGGQGSNHTKTRNAYVALAYESFRGNTATDSRVLSQLGKILDPLTMPCGMGGPAAAREASAICFMQLIKLTPRLWNSLTDTQKNRMECIVKALLAGAAWIISDTNPQIGGSDWYLTGFGSDVKSVGPNISFAPVAIIINASCYLGPDAANAFLKSYSHSTMRASILSLFGSTALLYRTWNWKSAGINASTAATYYRSEASTLAPSDAMIDTCVNSFKYYGKSMPDLFDILFPDGNHGMDAVIPPTFQSNGSNKFVGKVQHTCRNNLGYSNSAGVVYGTCLRNKEIDAAPG